jgi:hypothetical protein
MTWKDIIQTLAQAPLCSVPQEANTPLPNTAATLTRHPTSMVVEMIATREIGRKLAEMNVDWVRLKKVEHLKTQRQFRLEVLLEGEKETMIIHAHYAIEGNSITIPRLTASKPWLERALSDFILPQINAQKLPDGILGAVAKWML